jgi:multiple antibiotic resistance protein
LQTWKTFLIALSALLPMVNPVGSALQLLPLVGDAPLDVYRNLARRIAIDNIIFLLIVEVLGSAILRFFGISIPIVEVSGGIVIAGLGWSVLNRPAPEPRPADDPSRKVPVTADDSRFVQKVFYPFTFPITSGPATVVTMLTLSAHASRPTLAANLLAHAGIFAAAVVITASVFGCYAYAPKLARTVAPGTLQGIVRIVSFITLSIGVQIAWNGISALTMQLVGNVKH